jgi:sodium/hydrogen antiporter
VLLLVHAVTLMLPVLVSKRAERTVLSTAVLFLRFLPEPSVAQDPIRSLAERALLTHGLRLPPPGLRHAWRLPCRALSLEVPRTVAATEVSILLQSSTDAPPARWLERRPGAAEAC